MRAALGAAGALVSAVLLLAAAAESRAALPAGASAQAATLKRDSTRCSREANLEACYDAIRWSPSDPALLVATGDALVRAGRPADAIRTYRRAAQLEPNARGVAAKITSAEAKLAALNAASNRRFSNAAPETQSH